MNFTNNTFQVIGENTDKLPTDKPTINKTPVLKVLTANTVVNDVVMDQAQPIATAKPKEVVRKEVFIIDEKAPTVDKTTKTEIVRTEKDMHIGTEEVETATVNKNNKKRTVSETINNNKKKTAKKNNKLMYIGVTVVIVLIFLLNRKK